MIISGNRLNLFDRKLYNSIWKLLTGIVTAINTKRIYLVGLMGVGKTTIGKCIARQLRYTFYDTDVEIQKQTGADIPWIFEIEGEDGFRQREHAMLEQLSNCENAVIATGGGIVLDEGNRRLLNERGTCIYLQAPVNLLVERTRFSKNRPLLKGVDRREKFESLMRQRDHLYRKSAHMVVRSRRGSPKRMASKLIREIEKYEKAQR